MTADRHVHIIDSDAAMRVSTATLLHGHGYTTDRWPSGTAFLDAVERAKPGCILLALTMPGVDGIDVQIELARRTVTMPVVILTGHGSIAAAVRAMKAGAVDFLEQPVAATVLTGAIDAALDRLAGMQRHNASIDRARRAVAMLTPREHDVLDGLVNGLTNKRIAQCLAISVRTVEIHRANAMIKLDTPSLAHALRIAFTAKMAHDNEGKFPRLPHAA